MRSMGEARVCGDRKGARVEKSPSPSLSPKGERSMKEGTALRLPPVEGSMH